MDLLRPNFDEPEEIQSLVARSTIISRFPVFENHILEAFRRSSLFRELCADYLRVSVCLNELSLQGNATRSSDEEHLNRLKHELEQELFHYLNLHQEPQQPNTI